MCSQNNQIPLVLVMILTVRGFEEGPFLLLEVSPNTFKFPSSNWFSKNGRWLFVNFIPLGRLSFVFSLFLAKPPQGMGREW